MDNIANKVICLTLNSSWQPVGYGTVKDAITDLVSGESKMALNIEYVIKKDGTPDFNQQPESMYPLEWDQWIQLPIREWDLVIHSQKMAIRVPTIMIAKNFHTMPLKQWKGTPSKEAIYIRDGGKCQYTGQHLDKREATVDHIIPKSRGGNSGWTNLALTSKELNGKKGNCLNSEIGLRLIKQPTVPRPIPISCLIREMRHRDWKLFLNSFL
jgi:5-methylcytosine-specific restriction endonuclease McrA